MTNRQLVAEGPVATPGKSARVRTALASGRRLCLVTFLLAASPGITAAQTPQTNSHPTTARCSAIFFGSSTPAAAPKSGLDGTYTLDEADSDNITDVIEDAVGTFNFLTRPIARGRLKKLNPVYRKLSIASSANEICVSLDDQPPLRAPAKGTPIAWTGPDGEKVNVSMKLAGGRLVLTYNSADGRRVNDYTLSPDRRLLTMQVTETSPRFSQSIKYKQVYRRVP